MFSKKDLKDIALMIEDYYDRAEIGYNSNLATDSSRRMYANDMARAKELLGIIYVATSETEGNAS